MTPALLATLRAAGEAAAPGPWAPSEWYGTDEGGWSAVGPHHLKSEGEEWDDPDSECHERAKLDALFIALARNHWGELLDAAEERDRLRENIAKAEASTEKLERRVVANAGRLSSERKPRWAHVADATALGSTAAARLCSDHGFDCGELVGGGK